MSEKAGKPIDPAHEAKLAARREKHNAKVWAANPKTQGLKSAYDAALQQLQQLRDGTFCRQFAQMQQWCKRVEGEREAMEQQLMRVEGERGRRHIDAVFAKANEKAAERELKEVRDEKLKVELDLEEKVRDLEDEVAELKKGGRQLRGGPPEPDHRAKEEEESPVIKVYKIFAEDRREVTDRLGRIDKTLQGVVAALGQVASANGGGAKPKSSVVTPTCGQKRKRGGRGGDRRSALYLLQCRMGQIPLAEAINK